MQNSHFHMVSLAGWIDLNLPNIFFDFHYATDDHVKSPQKNFVTGAKSQGNT